MKILDCTLRDGGYYNKWDFESDVVNAYLRAVSEANIEYVELGLRNFPKETFLGAFAYTTEDYLNRLSLPSGPVYGVMVDAKTILSANMSIEQAIGSLFVDASESKLGLVRVAAHFDEVEHSEEIVQRLKNMGYLVGFNLMQAGGKPCEVIRAKVELISSWDLDVLYFADSLGNMDSAEVRRITAIIKESWNKSIGIHTHNNMSKGLDNSLTALDAGVEWIDSTITGMGRGAGNTQTENLLASLEYDDQRYNPKPIYSLVVKYFEKMQKQYGWGSNLLYFLGAKNNVHPTYVQTLLSDSHYRPDEIIGAIEYLSRMEGTQSYSVDVLKNATQSNDLPLTATGTTDLVNKFEGRELLVVASGPSVERYSDDIKAYIELHNPIVLSINVNEWIPESLVDYYCISHNTKFLSEKRLYSHITKPVILPKHRFTDDEVALLQGSEALIDYGIEIVANRFISGEEYCQLPYQLTAAYALAIATVSNASNVNLVGFDGYEGLDGRQNEMIEVLSLAKAAMSDIDLKSLTPTSYPMMMGSIYAPI